MSVPVNQLPNLPAINPNDTVVADTGTGTYTSAFSQLATWLAQNAVAYVVGPALGGSQGTGTINVSGGYFVNGNPILQQLSSPQGTLAIGSPTAGVVTADVSSTLLQSINNVLPGVYLFAGLPAASQYPNTIAVTSDQSVVASYNENWVQLYNPQTSGPTITTATFQTPVAQNSTGPAITLNGTGGTLPYTFAEVLKIGNNTVSLSGNVATFGTSTVESTVAVFLITDAKGMSSTAFVVQPITATVSPAATPVISVATGTYTGSQTVAITDTTGSASIYYTLNGSVPTAASTLYTGPLTITSTTTIKAIAIASGYTNSAVATSTLTIVQNSSYVNPMGINWGSANFSEENFPIFRNHIRSSQLGKGSVNAAGWPVCSNIVSVGTLTGTATAGSYSGVALTGGSGTGATATVVIGSGGTVSSVSISNGGSSYVVGDTLGFAVTGGSGTCVVTSCQFQLVLWQGHNVPVWLTNATAAVPFKCGFPGNGSETITSFLCTISAPVYANGAWTFDLYGVAPTDGSFNVAVSITVVGGASTGTTNIYAYLPNYPPAPGTTIDTITSGTIGTGAGGCFTTEAITHWKQYYGLKTEITCNVWENCRQGVGSTGTNPNIHNTSNFQFLVNGSRRNINLASNFALGATSANLALPFNDVTGLYGLAPDNATPSSGPNGMQVATCTKGSTTINFAAPTTVATTGLTLQYNIETYPFQWMLEFCAACNISIYHNLPTMGDGPNYSPGTYALDCVNAFLAKKAANPSWTGKLFLCIGNELWNIGVTLAPSLINRQLVVLTGLGAAASRDAQSQLMAIFYYNLAAVINSASGGAAAFANGTIQVVAEEQQTNGGAYRQNQMLTYLTGTSPGLGVPVAQVKNYVQWLSQAPYVAPTFPSGPTNNWNQKGGVLTTLTLAAPLASGATSGNLTYPWSPVNDFGDPGPYTVTFANATADVVQMTFSGATATDRTVVSWTPPLTSAVSSSQLNLTITLPTEAQVIAALLRQAPIQPLESACENEAVLAFHYGLGLSVYEAGADLNGFGQFSGNSVNLAIGASIVDTTISPSMTDVYKAYYQAVLDSGVSLIWHFHSGISFDSLRTGNYAGAGDFLALSYLTTGNPVTSANSPVLAGIQTFMAAYTPKRNYVPAGGGSISGANYTNNYNGVFPQIANRGLMPYGGTGLPYIVNFEKAGNYSVSVTTAGSGTATSIFEYGNQATGYIAVSNSVTVPGGATTVMGTMTAVKGPNYVLFGKNGTTPYTYNSITFTPA